MTEIQSPWNFNKENYIIQFENKPIEIFHFDKAPITPWFKGKSVAEALNYSNTNHALTTHVPEKCKSSLNTLIEKYGNLIDGGRKTRPPQNLNKNQLKTIYVDQSGLYALILRSKQPSAVEFQMWVMIDVLPSIQQSGSYSMIISEPPVTVHKSLPASSPAVALKGFEVAEGALDKGKSISAYDGKITVYLAVVIIEVTCEESSEIIDKEYVKWGKTDHANDRVDSHVRGFKRFKLWTMLEVKNSGKIENEFKNRIRAMGIDVGVKVNNRKYKELFIKPAEQSIEDFKNLLVQIIEEEDDEDCDDISIKKLRIEEKMAHEKEITERERIKYKRYLVEQQFRYKNNVAEQETRRIELNLKYKGSESPAHNQTCANDHIDDLSSEVIDIDDDFVSIDSIKEGDRMPKEYAEETFETIKSKTLDIVKQNNQLKKNPSKISDNPATIETAALAPIRKNRQAKRVAEINPINNTVIAIHNKREEIKEKYNMCLKTLKKKIDSNEIYLERRWIEADDIKESHEYFNIIRDFQRNVVTV